MNWKTLSTCAILTLAIAGCGDNTTPAPATSSAPTTAQMQANAEKLLADATQYVKDNKWDLADKAVAQLETMKPNLTPDNAKKVDDLKKMLDTAKAATRAAPKLP